MKKSSNRNLPTSDLRPDPTGASLLDAPEMQVYDRILMAEITGRKQELLAGLRELESIPTAHRYISRIIAAFEFAFGDFDSACIRFDLMSLPTKEHDRINEALRFRVPQFCLLLREFFGVEEMQYILQRSIKLCSESPAEASKKRPRVA
jgi:hypothetical protein